MVLLRTIKVDAVESGSPGIAARRRRSDGFGLIEVLVMLTLVSTVILVVMAGLLTAVKSSGVVATKRELAGSLTIAAERLQADSTGYQPCDAGVVDYPTTTPDPFVPDFPEVTFAVTASYFDGSQYQATCPGNDHGAQLLTITASRSGQTETAVVVKRDPTHCEGC
jgi:type II secretory pathway pseudopilin PulG